MLTADYRRRQRYGGIERHGGFLLGSDLPLVLDYITVDGRGVRTKARWDKLEVF